MAGKGLDRRPPAAIIEGLITERYWCATGGTCTRRKAFQLLTLSARLGVAS